VVKIDVEGAEAAVLAGGWKTLSQARAIVLEFHPTKLTRDFGVDRDLFWQDVCRLGKAIHALGVCDGMCSGWRRVDGETTGWPSSTTRLLLVDDRGKV